MSGRLWKFTVSQYIFHHLNKILVYSFLMYCFEPALSHSLTRLIFWELETREHFYIKVTRVKKKFRSRRRASKKGCRHAKRPFKCAKAKGNDGQTRHWFLIKCLRRQHKKQLVSEARSPTSSTERRTEPVFDSLSLYKTLHKPSRAFNKRAVPHDARREPINLNSMPTFTYLQLIYFFKLISNQCSDAK